MALPSSIPQAPAMLGADDAAKQEYFAALQKTLDALEARSQAQPNWFQMAGAFLEPGRTGSFGESVGRAANVLGQQQQRQEELQLPIAQMRAQIAGQKYETENQSKALQLMSSTLGMSPSQVQTALQSGNLPPDAAAKLMQIYPIVAQLSPKVGEIVKGTFTMQTELNKAAMEDRKAGMTQAELVAKYGPGVLQLMPGGAQQPGVTPPPATTSEAPVPGQQPIAPRPATQPSSGMAQDLQQLPLSAQAETAQKRVLESDKPYNLRRDEILTYTPQLLEASNTNLRQLDQVARKYPQIFGLMQEQGLLSGLLTAAQEGAQLTAGDFNARLGVPVLKFLEKTRLSPEEQQKVRDVSRIIGSEFLSNVRANKGLLGVNPTDNDARLLQAPMASIEDSAKAVQLWSRQQILLNKQREDLYTSYANFADRAGPTASPRKFFSPGSEYDRINKDYARLRMQLFRQFNPE